MALAKWWKIDFHTHTPESRCFPNKNITPKEWINAALDAGLNTVAVTDHNSVGWIGKLRQAREEIINENPKRDLFIFPGVELCVGTSLTHILVIFDPKMETSDIEEFLIRCGLLRNMWTDTTKSVREDVLADLIREYDKKVLIIPAHFNKNSGLCKELGQNGTAKFVELIRIDAIEVRDEDDINEFNNKVRNKAIPKVATITGSDNPGRNQADHDIVNFGKAYTWIKISEPSIEGLRQVFLDPDTRRYCVLRNEEGHQYDPNNVTQNYIAGLEIKNLKHVDNLNFRFSPNLNCIIGGRGSGKSTIVEMMRLALKKYDDRNIKEYKLINNTYQDNSCINLFYNFGDLNKYGISISGKKIKKNWVYENEEGVTEEYPEFPISIFSQKEIFSLVEDDENPEKSDESPLLRIIDENIITEKINIDEKLDRCKQEITQLSQRLISIRNQLRDVPKIKAEIELGNSKLDKFKNLGIIEKRDEISSLTNAYETLKNNLIRYTNCIDETNLQMNKLHTTILNDINDLVLNEESQIRSYTIKAINSINNEINTVLEKNSDIIKAVTKKIDNSDLKIKLDEKKDIYNSLISQINGIDVDNYNLIESRNREQVTKLSNLIKLKPQEVEIIEKIDEKISDYINLWKELYKVRYKIINEINENATNIKIDLHFLSHGKRWLYNLRKDLGKIGTFDDSFMLVYSKIFSEDILDIDRFHQWIKFILTSENGDIKHFLGTDINIDVRFENIWFEKFKDGILFTLFNFVPEDRVEIKIINDGQHININEGSPGQKSAAILAFILNQGNQPLIIDQPEDDLDNSLIMDLIVENIRKLKKRRQIIIVTHNANIPVLGDAEGIIMLSRNQQGKVIFKDGKKTGCIEEKVIKKGICDIMEGGIIAFKKRERKYKYIK
jgi:ABC-type cobalamin/Fe3+-siderophores transport system ATPase subunit